MRTQEQLQYTLSTQSIERQVPSTAALQLCKKVANRTISAEAAVARLWKQYGLEVQKYRG